MALVLYRLIRSICISDPVPNISDPVPKRNSPLLALPPELRIHIYRQTFQDLAFRVPREPTWWPYPGSVDDPVPAPTTVAVRYLIHPTTNATLWPPLVLIKMSKHNAYYIPNLGRTCKQLYCEILYETLSFYRIWIFATEPKLTHLTNILSNPVCPAWSVVTSLDIEFDTASPASIVRFVTRCHNLQSLKLHIISHPKHSYCLDIISSVTGRGPEDLGSIIHAPALKRLGLYLHRPDKWHDSIMLVPDIVGYRRKFREYEDWYGFPAKWLLYWDYIALRASEVEEQFVGLLAIIERQAMLRPDLQLLVGRYDHLWSRETPSL